MSGSNTQPDLDPIVQSLLGRVLSEPQRPAQAPAADPSFVSLLGSALGGGGGGLSGADREQAGNAALMNFGINMLANSGWTTNKKTFGQIMASGLAGAQESMGRSQEVAAARGAAQQQAEKDRQEQQLARLKEALPLLTLQQQLQQRKALQGLKSPFDSSAAGGSLAPVAAGAPTTYEAAIGGFEGTGKNPASTAFGTGQFLESTWRDFAAANPDLFKGMSPEQVLAARANPELGNKAITWLAQQNAAALASNGVSPSGAALGIAHWVGAKPAAAIMNAADNVPVSQFLSPEAVKANPQLATMTAGQMRARYANVPNPSFLAPKSPATATTTAPQAPAKAAPPPDTTAPDVAPTGNLVAGPGAPSGGAVPPPLTAGATGNADAIAAGMVKAGAAPSTLAPGGGSGPPAPGSVTAQTGGLVVPAGATPPPGVPTAPAGPPQVTPDAVPKSFEEYLKQHPIVPDDQTRTLFSTAPDAAQLANLQTQKKLAETAYKTAQATGNAAGMASAAEAYNTILASENTLRENAAKLGREAQSGWTKDRLTEAKETWQKMRDVAESRETERLKAIREQTDKMREEELKHTNALALEKARAEEARRTAAAATENAYVGKERERFSTERDGARTSLDDLSMLRALSDAAQTSTPLDNIQVGNRTGRDLMAGWGLGTEAQQKKWGAQQAFEAAINHTVLELRKGISLGALSDRDMAFLQRMAPDLLQKPETRASIIALLEQAQHRKLRYTDTVEELHDGGMKWGEAKREAQKRMPDYVPQVPKEYSEMAPAEKLQWFRANVKPLTIYRDPNGDLRVAPAGGY